MKNRIILFITSLLVPFLGKAQTVAAPEMADTFRSEGKIYVVITVISIIFICLIGYLMYIDIKLRKLENKNRNTN
jgi:heme/copper-type cytochrome/quinol oxidase subunit 2